MRVWGIVGQSSHGTVKLGKVVCVWPSGCHGSTRASVPGPFFQPLCLASQIHRRRGHRSAVGCMPFVKAFVHAGLLFVHMTPVFSNHQSAGVAAKESKAG